MRKLGILGQALGDGHNPAGGSPSAWRAFRAEVATAWRIRTLNSGGEVMTGKCGALANPMLLKNVRW